VIVGWQRGVRYCIVHQLVRLLGVLIRGEWEKAWIFSLSTSSNHDVSHLKVARSLIHDVVPAGHQAGQATTEDEMVKMDASAHLLRLQLLRSRQP
jgi:hypothetical protein